MKLREKLAIIADKLEDIYEQSGENYVSFTCNLSSSGTGISYNIYTYEIMHNSFTNYEEFMAFLDKVSSTGEKVVRIKHLRALLREELHRKKEVTERIKEINQELEDKEMEL